MEIDASLNVRGAGMSCADAVRAADPTVPVRLAPEALERVRRAHRAAVESTRTRPVYGRTTGVGANRHQTVEAGEASEHALRLLRSHCGGAGPPLPDPVVRTALVIRLNQLAAGGSGVHPRLAVALEEALRAGALPAVRSRGAIGTGDLSGLAGIALTLAGELPWARGGIEPVAVEPGDALAFISSSAVTLAEAVHAHHRLERLLRAGQTITALSFCALGGSGEALAPRVHELRPHPGAGRAAAELRRLLGGMPGPGLRLQDPFGLRSFPQMQGPALEAVEALGRVLEVDLNAVVENPMIDAETGEVYHHGQFSTAPVTLALDHTRAAVHHVAQLSAARLKNLVEPSLTGLGPFLASGPPGSSGVMILEYTAHDALSELRQAAVPVTLSDTSISRGLEDHAGYAGLAARSAAVAADAWRLVLAAELLAAIRALQLTDGVRVPAGAPVQQAFEAASEALPLVAEDHVMSGELDVAEGLVDSLAEF